MVAVEVRDGGPAGERWRLETEEEERPGEEPLDAGALAQFLLGPGEGQAGTILLLLGVPGDDRHGPKCLVDPGDQRAPPVGGVQPHDTWAEGEELGGGGHEGSGEGSVMPIGRGHEEERGQARGTADPGVDAGAPQEPPGMLDQAWAFWFIGQIALYACVGLVVAALAVLASLLFEVFVAPKQQISPVQAVAS